MIEGITVLNQEVVLETASWIMPTLCILCAIVFLICNEINEDYGFIIALFISFIMIGIFLGLIQKVPTDRHRYTVTIDETVSFEKVLEKYDVVDQQGKMWILEDKEK